MNIKRRDFLGFFLLGGLASLMMKKLRPKDTPHPTFPYEGEAKIAHKEAMFWRRKA